MKRILLFALILISGCSFGQTFYLEPTEKGFEKGIAQKLDFEGVKIASSKEGADYLIAHHYQKNKRNYKFEGYVTITDKEGKEIFRSKTVSKAASAFNGYQAMPAILDIITEKELLPVIKKGL